MHTLAVEWLACVWCIRSSGVASIGRLYWVYWNGLNGQGVLGLVMWLS